jgi:fibulin 1/2
LSDNERSCQDIDECEAPEGSPCRGEGQQCFNTRGGFKCVDTSCPTEYDREQASKRCKLRPASRLCSDPQDVTCLRRPVSISFNFIALVSDLRVAVTGPSQLGIDLFTMQSARYYTLTTKFTLEVKRVRAAKDVREEADRSFFRLSTPEPHRAIVALVKSLQGPQDILLELRMDMYHLGRYQASAVANLYIFVTPYRF